MSTIKSGKLFTERCVSEKFRKITDRKTIEPNNPERRQKHDSSPKMNSKIGIERNFGIHRNRAPLNLWQFGASGWSTLGLGGGHLSLVGDGGNTAVDKTILTLDLSVGFYLFIFTMLMVVLCFGEFRNSVRFRFCCSFSGMNRAFGVSLDCLVLLFFVRLFSGIFPKRIVRWKVFPTLLLTYDVVLWIASGEIWWCGICFLF